MTEEAVFAPAPRVTLPNPHTATPAEAPLPATLDGWETKSGAAALACPTAHTPEDLPSNAPRSRPGSGSGSSRPPLPPHPAPTLEGKDRDSRGHVSQPRTPASEAISEVAELERTTTSVGSSRVRDHLRNVLSDEGYKHAVESGMELMARVESVQMMRGLPEEPRSVSVRPISAGSRHSASRPVSAGSQTWCTSDTDTVQSTGQSPAKSLHELPSPPPDEVPGLGMPVEDAAAAKEAREPPKAAVVPPRLDLKGAGGRRPPADGERGTLPVSTVTLVKQVSPRREKRARSAMSDLGSPRRKLASPHAGRRRSAADVAASPRQSTLRKRQSFRRLKNSVPDTRNSKEKAERPLRSQSHSSPMTKLVLTAAPELEDGVISLAGNNAPGAANLSTLEGVDEAATPGFSPLRLPITDVSGDQSPIGLPHLNADRRGSGASPSKAAATQPLPVGDEDPFMVGPFTPPFTPSEDNHRPLQRQFSTSSMMSVGSAASRLSRSLASPRATRRKSRTPTQHSTTVPARRKSRACNTPLTIPPPFTLQTLAAYARPCEPRSINTICSGSAVRAGQHYSTRVRVAEAATARMYAAVRQELPTLSRPKDLVNAEDLAKPGAKRQAVVACVTAVKDTRVAPNEGANADAWHLATALSRLGYGVTLLASGERGGDPVQPPTRDNIMAAIAAARRDRDPKDRDAGVLVCYIGLTPVPSLLSCDKAARGYFLTEDSTVSPEMTLRTDSVHLTRAELLQKAGPHDALFFDTVSVFGGDLPDFHGETEGLAATLQVFPAQESFGLEVAPQPGGGNMTVVEPGGQLSGRYVDSCGYLATFYFTKGMRGSAVRDRIISVNSMNVYLSAKLAAKGLTVHSTASNLHSGGSALAGKPEMAAPLPYDRKGSANRKAVARDVPAWVELDVLVSRHRWPDLVALGQALLKKIDALSAVNRGRAGSIKAIQRLSKDRGSSIELATAAAAFAGTRGGAVETEIRRLLPAPEVVLLVETPAINVELCDAEGKERATGGAKMQLKRMDIETAVRDMVGTQEMFHRCASPRGQRTRAGTDIGIAIQTAMKGAQQRCSVQVVHRTPPVEGPTLLSRVLGKLDAEVAAIYAAAAEPGVQKEEKKQRKGSARRQSIRSAKETKEAARASFTLHAEVDAEPTDAKEAASSYTTPRLQPQAPSAFALSPSPSGNDLNDAASDGGASHDPAPRNSRSIIMQPASPDCSAAASPRPRRSVNMLVPGTPEPGSVMSPTSANGTPAMKAVKADCRVPGLFGDCTRHLVYDVCEVFHIRIRASDYVAHKIDRACRSGELAGLFRKVRLFRCEIGAVDNMGVADAAACFIQEYWRSACLSMFYKVWVKVQTSERRGRREVEEEEYAELQAMKMEDIGLRLKSLGAEEEWYRGDKMVWEHEEFDMLRKKFTGRLQAVRDMEKSGRTMPRDYWD
eukprot:TRINITY_DN4092_c0_g1_i1.p1 TRINITY_DN4092_c0_g1~~TRINITY_DN4092_c0_g1_i1.p1  ORF type:complete len:1511 (+),score=393.66 TRINITY_DN4092_c0_g1_i1:242-4534(+)